MRLEKGDGKCLTEVEPGKERKTASLSVSLIAWLVVWLSVFFFSIPESVIRSLC